MKNTPRGLVSSHDGMTPILITFDFWYYKLAYAPVTSEQKDNADIVAFLLRIWKWFFGV